MRGMMAIVLLAAGPVLGQAGDDMRPPSGTPAARSAIALPQAMGEIGRRIAAAEAGEVIHIPPGVYHEHIRIDKPLTLIGNAGGQRAIIDGGGRGDIVEIAAADVVFRGFVVRNTGIDLDTENAGIRVLAPRVVVEDNVLEDILFGIDLRDSPQSIVRGNRVGGKDLDIARRGDGIRLWRADDAVIEGNVIHDGRDAILWYSNGVTVRGNTSFRCRYGLHLMFSDSVRIEENELSENSVGIYLMYSAGVEVHRNKLIRNRGPSGYGLGLKETDRFTVSDNLFVGNRVGVYLDGSPFTAAKPGEFYHNTFAHNDIGMTFLPSVKGNMLWENNFIDNIEQISISGRGQLTGNQFWKEIEGGRGNFWSDYTGYDQNRDGIGDFVHESQTLFENLLDREPKLRILLFSPVQQAVEFVGRALPAVRPEPKFMDEVPLMAPMITPMMAGDAAHGGGGGALALVAAGLLSLGGMLLWSTQPAPAERRHAQGPRPEGGGAS
jgi:nitrous oxidase accessory protein